MRFTHLSSLALIAVLAGCSSADKPEQADQPANLDGRCNAEAVQNLLGQTVTRELVDQAQSQAGAQTTRVLSPGDAVTMDYNSQRLNIDIDEAESIVRITCG